MGAIRGVQGLHEVPRSAVDAHRRLLGLYPAFRPSLDRPILRIRVYPSDGHAPVDAPWTYRGVAGIDGEALAASAARRSR